MVKKITSGQAKQRSKFKKAAKACKGKPKYRACMKKMLKKR